MSGQTSSTEPDVVTISIVQDAELIAWGSQLAPFYGVAPTTAPVTEPPKPDESAVLREQLTKSLRLVVPENATAASLVPGSAPGELDEVLLKASQLATQIGTVELSVLKTLGDAVGTIETGLGAIKTAVTERGAEKRRLLKRAVELKTPEDALEGEKEGPAKLRKQIAEFLAADPPTSGALTQADGAVEQLAKAVDELGKILSKRRERHEALLKEAETITPPEGAETGEIEALKTAKGNITTPLGTKPITDDKLDEADKALETGRQQLGELTTAIAERNDEDRRIREEAGKIVDPVCLPDQEKALADARSSLKQALDKPVGTQRNIDAGVALTKLRETAETVATELSDLGGMETVNELCKSLGVPPTEFGPMETALGGRAAAGKMLAAFPPAKLGPFCQEFGGGAAGATKLADLATGFGGADKLKTAVTDIGAGPLVTLTAGGKCDGAAAKKLYDDLGAPFLGALLEAKTPVEDVLKLQKGFGSDPKPLQDLLKEGGFAAKPKALVSLFSKGCEGKPDKLVELCSAFAASDDRKTLKSLIEDGGLGDAPDALGELLATGCGGKPDGLKKFGAAFDDKDKRDGLKRALTEGGLAGEAGVIDPKCLAQLFKDGAGPKPDGVPGDDDKRRADALASLLKELKQSDCKQLKTVLSEGGLGTAPDALGHLVGLGCGADAAKLNTLTAAFDDKAKRDGLKGMLGDGKLEGESDKDGKVIVDPRCLAWLLKEGAGPPPDGFTGDDDKRKSAALARLCGGIKDPAPKNVAAMLEKGGLGTEPALFGHLVGLGCAGGDPAKLGELGAELNKSPANLKNLDDLLKKGALGTKDDTGADTKTDPKCLGQLYGLGCEKKPDELVKLANALDAGDRTKLAEVMKNGGLGTRPEVFGNAYKFGCVTDPYDDPDKYADPASTKNPDMIKKLLVAFGTTADAPKLEEMLKDGGLGKQPAWLGKLMRDAFTDHVYPAPPPLPSGKAQDPGKLKDLHTAFAGEMPKLKVMIEAMGEMPLSCGEDDEPGRALQNVHKSANVPINQLQTQFFDKISVRAGGTNGTGGPTGGIVITGASPPPVAASLSTRELIQNAASMEFDALDDDEPSLMASNGKAYLANVLHVMERHHRHAPAKVRAGGGNNSSMFPKMVNLGGPKPVRLTEAMIDDVIKDAIGQCILAKLHPVPAPPPPRNAPGAVNPPKQHGDMNAMHQRSYRTVPGTIPGATFQMTIGFSCVGPTPPSSHASNPAHDVRVGQAFPTGGTNVVEVNDLDYVAIKDALGR